ncbi:hypothetical protein AC1031_011813 [Aphanomyces cochlioides]|nr:hypothetical protein AC1031_011813 [Aphanomyces cochlioides]
MMEYWGDKAGNQRTSLLTSDTVSDDGQPSSDNENDEDIASEVGSSTSESQMHGHRAKRRADFKKDETSAKKTKSKTQADALELGLNAVKEGLVALGNSIASTSNQHNHNEVSLKDVLAAIQDQSEAFKQQSQVMNALLKHLLDKENNDKDV